VVVTEPGIRASHARPGFLDRGLAGFWGSPKKAAISTERGRE
jgi:hypothetical protein